MKNQQSIHRPGVRVQRFATRIQGVAATLCGAWLATASVRAVDLTTSYTENFDSMGTAGTSAPAGWNFYAIGASSGTWTDATGIPAASVAGGTANATLVVATPPGSNSGNAGINGGLAASNTDRALTTAPTGSNGSALQLSVTNTSGGALTGVYVGYDTRRFTAGSAANELPGFWLFYSLDNGTTWTSVAALNPTIATVPNTVGVTATDPSLITFSSALADGSTVLLRWVDDNASQSSPDQINGLDNVIISVTDPNATLANIKTFTFGALGAATISGTNISITVPDGTDVSALTPTFTLSTGATCDHDNGGPAAYDFTNPQTYTVTSQDSSVSKAYTVTVNFQPVVTYTNTALTINAAATGAEILHGAVLVEANHFYSTASTVTLASGLTFGSSWTHTNPTGLSAGNQRTDSDAHTHVSALTDITPGSAAAVFRTLMRSYTWSSSNTHLIDIPGLTPGHTYRLQLVSSDGASAKVSVEGVLWASTWAGNNKVLTATWIQSPGDTVANVLLARNGPELETTAYALHDLSVLPSTATALTPTPLVGEIRLDWTKANGAAAYNIKRSTTSGSGYVTIGTTTDPNTIYHDTTVSDGVTYYYVVSTTNAAGEGPDSDEVSSTPSVNQANQTISFNLGLSLSRTTLAPAFVDTASASSGLTVTYSSDNETVASVDEFGTVTIHGIPGVAHILADQAGNFAYLPAEQVSQELTVTAVMPVITWNNPRAIAFGTLLSGTQLNATATTSGTFTYTPDAGEELPLGSHTLTVHFTPANEVAYSTPADKTVSITVGEPAGPTVINVNYGTASNASMNGIYSFDPTARGSASQPAPAAYGGNRWNDFGGDTGSANLLDSFGTSTGVGFSWGPAAVSSPYNDWNGLGGNRLLISGRFLNTTTYAALFTLTGLNPAHQYDLYLASLHNTESNSIDFQAVGAATTTLHCQYVNATGWVAGQNHVRFTGLSPASDGTLVVNSQRPGGGYLNGFQVVDLGSSNSADYNAWAAGFTGDLSDPAADLDGDGMSNQKEYAFGLDPSLGSSVNPITLPLDKTSGTFSYSRRLPALTGLSYVYEWSTTLAGAWGTFDPVVDPPATNAGDPVEIITVVVPPAQLANPELFVRVRAQ